MAKIAETPLMKQYLEMKRRHPDALLLFRVGDFYETFSQDAIDSSLILGITLTKRANGAAQSVELAGFPHHALDTYLPKLVRAGRRVAICEQLEDPKTTKKLVKRGITELVTPGVNLSNAALAGRDNNFLAGVYFGKHATGVAFLDISTGEFLCAQGDNAYVDKLLTGIAPSEVLRQAGTKNRYTEAFSLRASTFELEEWIYTSEAARTRLLRQFGTSTLKGFGIDSMEEAVIAAGSLLHYLDLTEHRQTSHITSLARIDRDRYIHLDRFTVRNLELVQPMAADGKSLLEILDCTSTPMGSRLLRRWLLFPLLDKEEIDSRLDTVDDLFRNPETRDTAASLLPSVGDLERICSLASTRRIGPRMLLQLRDSLEAIASLKGLLEESGSGLLEEIGSRLDPCTDLAERITRTISPDCPALASKGGVIAPGVDAALDELRDIVEHGKDALGDILRRESERTLIPSLKISFNNVFGYYIEVRNTHRDKVPPEWIRKQTLVNAERYVTPELKEYEGKIMGAEEKIAMLEAELYSKLLEIVEGWIPKLMTDAQAVARLDVLHCFAQRAADYHYVRPQITDTLTLRIEGGRHPVIERLLPPGEQYVANSLTLDSDDCQIMMITGPNMSGKSALLRQTALITLMAQCGCFVPAESASVGIVDKIFTRVGASDNISLGESTFMVEMNEAAAILNNMSERSLILFDELGRGTSTYDGISIAWSIVEHIHENGRCRPKTLFATHYHELNEMERSFRRIVNYNVSVEEIKGKVVFLRKLQRGGSAHSFGIHVAKLAGMPVSIVKRAGDVLRQLEDAASGVNPGEGSTESRKQTEGSPKPTKADVSSVASAREGYQMSFFQLDDPLLSQIRDRLLSIDIDRLTPLEALTTLHDIQSLLKGK